MEKAFVYQCKECGNAREVRGNSQSVPRCCETPMEKLKEIPVCVKAPEFAEHARFEDRDEPCDDGRAGRM